MPYQLSIDSERGIVRVTASGPITLEEALAGRTESLQACRLHAINRVLADLLAGEWQLEMGDALNFGLTIAEAGFPSGTRFAALCRKGDRLPEVAIRALSLSGIAVRQVASEAEAYAYLSSPYI